MTGGRARSRSIMIFPSALIGSRATDAAVCKVIGIEKAVQFIHRDAHRPFALDEVLEVSAMPKESFEQEFFAQLGIDPCSFINRCRIERACMLLSGRKKRTVKQVSSMSGFTDERRFRIIFRRLMGVTPAVYQRKKRRAPSSEWNAPNNEERVKTAGALAH